MLLIITSENDFTADYLILRLIELNLPYLRINSEQLFEFKSTFRVTQGENERYILTPDGKNINLSDVRTVWYRRIIDPSPHDSLSFAQSRFVSGELRHLWTGLLINPTIKWVNPIDKVYIGEHKVFQLRIANQIGFSVPETLISSKAEELSEFVNQVGNVICKPIFHGLFVDGENRYSIYTRRVTSDSFTEQKIIDLCPVFLQQEIQRSADVRITIIGESCFGVSITSDDSTLIDWRKPGLTLEHKVINIPISIKQKCLEMMNIIGLKYAAFDFIETPTKELVFLEVNPTGEWAWLEDKLGLPMRDAFIKLFYKD